MTDRRLYERSPEELEALLIRCAQEEGPSDAARNRAVMQAMAAASVGAGITTASFAPKLVSAILGKGGVSGLSLATAMKLIVVSVVSGGLAMGGMVAAERLLNPSPSSTAWPQHQSAFAVSGDREHPSARPQPLANGRIEKSETPRAERAAIAQNSLSGLENTRNGPAAAASAVEPFAEDTTTYPEATPDRPTLLVLSGGQRTTTAWRGRGNDVELPAVRSGSAVVPSPRPPQAVVATPTPSVRTMPRPPAARVDSSSRPGTAPGASARAATVPETSPQSAEPSLMRELTVLEAARGAIENANAEQALAQLDQHRRDFAGGRLTIEAAALRIEALAALSRRTEAIEAADAFLSRYPDSPLADRVRALRRRLMAHR